MTLAGTANRSADARQGSASRQKRRFQAATPIARNLAGLAPNLIGQNFHAERHDEKWGADISYV